MINLSLNEKDLELLKVALTHAISDIEQQSINAYHDKNMQLFDRLAAVKRDTIAMQDRVIRLNNVLENSL